MSLSSAVEMNKTELLQRIVERLGVDLDVAQRAAQTAYEAATAEENIAENKYDTLGLEASYLATGQARRMEEIRQARVAYQQLHVRDYDPEVGIQVSNLVLLADQHDQRQRLFLGPEAAGLKMGEGDALVQKALLAGLLAPVQFFQRQRRLRRGLGSWRCGWLGRLGGMGQGRADRQGDGQGQLGEARRVQHVERTPDPEGAP